MRDPSLVEPMLANADDIIQAAYKGILTRNADSTGLMTWTKRLESEPLERLFASLVKSDEFFRGYILRQVKEHGFAGADSICNHLALYLAPRVLHPLRLELVQNHLPAARRVLDLGGASSEPEGALLAMGYRPPKELVIVDLPPDIRFKRAAETKQDTKFGKTHIRYEYHSMGDLSRYADASFDLVWSGQTIEHVTIEDGTKIFEQVRRILKPGGVFALDTPNGAATRLMVGEGKFIHAEHKIEYPFEMFIQRYANAGLKLVEAKGLIDMKASISSGVCEISELRQGAINDSPATSYVFFVKFIKE